MIRMSRAERAYRREEADKSPWGLSETLDMVRDLRADYDAARESRYRSAPRGISYLGTNADWHYRHEGDLFRVCEWARAFDRNNCLIGQAVTRLIDNVLMGGPTLSPETGDPKLDTDLYQMAMDIAGEPDLVDCQGKATLHELASLVARHVVVDGDMAVIPLDDLTVQTMEYHRLRSPTKATYSGKAIDNTGAIIHGVQLSRLGRPTKYYFTQTDNGFNESVTIKDLVATPAYVTDQFGTHRNVWHAMWPKRTSQTRGVSMFAPVFDLIGMHDDVQLAKLVQQQVASCITFIRQKVQTGGMGTPGQPLPMGAETTETQADGSTRTATKLVPGTEMRANENEEIKPWSPNIPGDGWLDQATLIISLIAINLNLPPMVFLLDPSSNFSGHRGAMEQARIGFRKFQRMVISKFYCPWYKFQVRQAISRDTALMNAYQRLGDKIVDHDWRPPAWPYLQPMEEAAARAFRRGKLLASPRQIAAEESAEWETVADHTIEDNAYLLEKAAAKAEELTKKFNGRQTFTWQQVLEPVPSGVTQQFVSPSQVTDQPAQAASQKGGNQ